MEPLGELLRSFTSEKRSKQFFKLAEKYRSQFLPHDINEQSSALDEKSCLYAGFFYLII